MDDKPKLKWAKLQKFKTVEIMERDNEKHRNGNKSKSVEEHINVSHSRKRKKR